MNHVELCGTIVQESSLAYTASALAVLELQLAGTDHLVGSDGRLLELPWYHRVTVFGEYAVSLADSLVPGVAVYVIGQLRYRTWEGPDGHRRSDVDVVADTVRILGLPAPDRVTRDARGQDRLSDATNRVLVAGNATRDAELRYTPSGHAVLDLGVAVHEWRPPRNGQKQERTHFVDVTAWRELAEDHGEVGKGAGLVVVGRLVTDSWSSPDGRRHYRTKVEASRLFPTLRRGQDPLHPSLQARDDDAADAELPF